MEFGFTNDVDELNRVKKFRDDAIDDGWFHKPTYDELESEDSSCSLEKSGFKMLILTRDYTKKEKSTCSWKYEASIDIWGPDGLVIHTKPNYDWEDIQKGLNRCLNCGKENVEVFRAGFAGRYCKDCLPEQKKLQEYPGWTN